MDKGNDPEDRHHKSLMKSTSSEFKDEVQVHYELHAHPQKREKQLVT